MNKKKFEQDGTPVSSRRLYEEKLVQAAELMMRVDDMIGRAFDDGLEILDFRVKAPGIGAGDYFVVVRGRAGGTGVVAFSSGDTFMEAVRVTLSRLENGSLKWQEDKYASKA